VRMVRTLLLLPPLLSCNCQAVKVSRNESEHAGSLFEVWEKGFEPRSAASCGVRTGSPIEPGRTGVLLRTVWARSCEARSRVLLASCCPVSHVRRERGRGGASLPMLGSCIGTVNVCIKVP